MSKYNLYKYLIDGGYGDVSGMFIATPDDVDALIGQYVNFGEILGKHSDVSHTFRRADIVQLDVTPLTIIDLAKNIKDTDIVGSTTTICGINPFEYITRYVLCENCGFTGDAKYDLEVEDLGGDYVDKCPKCGVIDSLIYSYKEFNDD